MALILNEEQTLLKDSAKDLMTAAAPVTQFRALRDAKDELGYSKDLWTQMVDMGWAGICIPEEFGGLDFGFHGLGIVLEETGRTLAASPLVASILVSASAVTLGGNETQKKQLLPKLAEGTVLMALALDETAHFSPHRIATRAESSAGSYKINGAKVFVLDGHIADTLIVATRTSGNTHDRQGITLFLVDRAAAGVEVTRTQMVDSRNAAKITFTNVSVEASAILGELDRGADILDPVLDRAALGMAAEMLGASLEIFERTLAYLKERTQFETKIGSFQSLQHRAVDMYCNLELSKSILIDALSALDEGRNADLPTLASSAKAQLCETLHQISSEGVQMHGGIGMTDEHEIGFFLKRARVAEKTFGDAGYHYDRLATLNGY
ncbi:MAG: acyl-CoA dehydrogenase family protein [SAR86 cluster bacterium]|jgi:alkylation response protein AidB-like acyl-CoA dehydrogenase|tara:strand:- start:4136 stop:5278 length:1143 start_codon:yes stop_codon:yes gene_type:complete